MGLKSPKKGVDEMARINLRFDQLLADTPNSKDASLSPRNLKPKDGTITPKTVKPTDEASRSGTISKPVDETLPLRISPSDTVPKTKGSSSPRPKNSSISPRIKELTLGPSTQEPASSPRIKACPVSPRIKEPLSIKIKSVSPTRERKDKSQSPRGILSPQHK